VNNIVAGTVAWWELAMEQANRRAWRLRIENAEKFNALAELTHG
jgi:hypothetical protein